MGPDITFLLGGLLSFYIFVQLIYGLLIHHRKKSASRAIHWFSLISIPVFVYSFFSFAWAFEILSYFRSDFLAIFSIILLFQTLLVYRSFYNINKRKDEFLWLLFYLVSPIMLISSFKLFTLTILISSSLLLLGFSLKVTYYDFRYRFVGYAGIAYSLILLITSILEFLDLGNLYIMSLISLLFFGIFSHKFIMNASNYMAKPGGKDLKHASGLSLFVKYFVYLIVIVNLVLFGTIGVHEFSHVATARYYDCESRAIVYESGSYPYSEIICDDLSNQFEIALMGPLIPLIIAILLFFVGGPLIRPMSFLIAGFNLMASYRDLQDMGLSSNFSVGSTLIGFILLIIGLVYLIHSRLYEDVHRDEVLKH